MRIIALKNITRDENYIYYRRNFDAVAEFEFGSKQIEAPIKFLIETTPFGTKEISIFGLESVNYPVLPLKKAIIEYISKQDSEGKLP